MMNSSRPVTDPKLAVFGVLIARSLWLSLGKSNSRFENPNPEETSHVLRRFKDFESTTEKTFLPLHLACEGMTPIERPGILPQSRKCQTSMSAFGGNPEDICSC